MITTIIVGLQWGDEGKGKIVGYISWDYGAEARFNGGANESSTVVINCRKIVFHLMLSVALREKMLFKG